MAGSPTDSKPIRNGRQPTICCSRREQAGRIPRSGIQSRRLRLRPVQRCRLGFCACQRQSLPAGARLHADADGALRHPTRQWRGDLCLYRLVAARATPTSSSTSRRSSTPTAITKAASGSATSSPNKNYEIALYARNITDRANLQGGIDFDDNTGFVNDPRIVGIEFTLRTH